MLSSRMPMELGVVRWPVRIREIKEEALAAGRCRGKAPLELLDAEGKPIKLNRGQTWIAAVPNGSGSIGWK